MREFLKNNNLEIPLQTIQSGDVTINLEYAEKDLVALCLSYLKAKYSIDSAEIYVDLWDEPNCCEALYQYEFSIDLDGVSESTLDKLNSNPMFCEECEDILKAALKNKFTWAQWINIIPRRESDFIEGELVMSNIFDIRLGFKKLEKYEYGINDFKSLLLKFDAFRMLKREKDGIIIEDFYINGDGEPRISSTRSISKDDYREAFLEVLKKEHPGKKELDFILDLDHKEIDRLKRQAIEDIESYVDTWIYDEGMDSFNELVDFFMENVDINTIETNGYIQSVVEFFNSDKNLYCCICRSDD